MINFRKYSRLHEAKKVKKPIPGDAINIFDIDDTLVVTAAKIRVYDPTSGEEHAMTPSEYNEYEHMPHHELDFTDFDDMQILKDGQLIEWVMNILKKTMAKGKAVGIITARSAGKKALSEFFKHHGIKIHPDLIFSVNDPSTHYKGDNAERKQTAFEELIAMGYKKFRFFDDDFKNLQYAKELESKHREVKMTLHHIQPKWKAKMTEAYADRVLEKNEDRDQITKWWALFAHISDHFVKAKNPKDLMNKFNDARKKSNSDSKAWPMEAIKYFYTWHLSRVKDKKREKKAELMQTESLQYYNENIKMI
jgi:hypothetical protein